VIKYFEDQLRARDATIDKLRLKNSTLKAAQGKAEASLRQKEEVGDVLHYIDFHQLQIENKQYLARIEEKNAELLRLKLTTGNTVQALNTLKSRLSELSKQASSLRGDIRGRSQLLAKLRAENAAVATAVVESQAVGEALATAAREAEDMPRVGDYVELCRLEKELGREVASWGRKVEIIEVGARQATIRLKKSGALGGTGEDWAAGTLDVDIFGSTAGAPAAGRTVSAGPSTAGASYRTRPQGVAAAVPGPSPFAPAPARGVAGFAGSVSKGAPRPGAPAGGAGGTLRLGRPQPFASPAGGAGAGGAAAGGVARGGAGGPSAAFGSGTRR
jgi:hypothetical protein